MQNCSVIVDEDLSGLLLDGLLARFCVINVVVANCLVCVAQWICLSYGGLFVLGVFHGEP